MQKKVYLFLAMLGVVLPYTQFVPWSNANGFDLRLMGKLMFANQIAAGIAIDALLAAVAIIIFMVFDNRKTKVKYLWIPVIGIFLSGIAFAFPMYLYLRECALENRRIE